MRCAPSMRAKFGHWPRIGGGKTAYLVPAARVRWQGRRFSPGRRQTNVGQSYIFLRRERQVQGCRSPRFLPRPHRVLAQRCTAGPKHDYVAERLLFLNSKSRERGTRSRGLSRRESGLACEKGRKEGRDRSIPGEGATGERDILLPCNCTTVQLYNGTIIYSLNRQYHRTTGKCR